MYITRFWDRKKQRKWMSWNRTYLRLNFEVSLSKKESPRPPLPPPLPWLTDDTSLSGTANVAVLVGTAADLGSFTVLPEIVVRYAMPRLKFMLLPAATAGDTGERVVAAVFVVEPSSDGLHTHTQQPPSSPARQRPRYIFGNEQHFKDVVSKYVRSKSSLSLSILMAIFQVNLG